MILAEDSQKFFDNRSEKSDPGPIVSGSRQIYLTFPAESTFTEEDVSNYFKYVYINLWKFYVWKISMFNSKLTELDFISFFFFFW